MSDIDNWYSWNARLYKYTDTTFNTYTAYAWQITFTKYDNSSSHTIFMTENGTILNVETEQKPSKLKPILYAYVDNEKNKHKIAEMLGIDSYISMDKYNKFNQPLTLTYPDVSISNANVTAYNLCIRHEYSSYENYIIYI